MAFVPAALPALPGPGRTGYSLRLEAGKEALGQFFSFEDKQFGMTTGSLLTGWNDWIESFHYTMDCLAALQKQRSVNKKNSRLVPESLSIPCFLKNFPQTGNLCIPEKTETVTGVL